MTLTVAAMTVRAALDEATAALAAAGVASPRADAEWLLAGVLGVGRAALGLHLGCALAAATAERYVAAVHRREQREPLQRIAGWEAFRGLRVALTDDVLVPRPETEMLVDVALGGLVSASGRQPVVVDVGTGSGCIACAIAAERPHATVIAVDVSRTAADVARSNAAALGLGDRVRVLVGDLASTFRPCSADLVVANLPYLPDPLIATLAPEVSEHDPRLALAGGADGLDAVRRLVPQAAVILRAGGTVALETAGAAQAAVVARCLTRAGFVDVVVSADLAGVARFVAARLRPRTRSAA